MFGRHGFSPLRAHGLEIGPQASVRAGLLRRLSGSCQERKHRSALPNCCHIFTQARSPSGMSCHLHCELIDGDDRRTRQGRHDARVSK
jgi:hypothetical protein